MRLLPRGGFSSLFPLVIMLLLAMLTLWLSRTTGLASIDEEGAALNEPDYIVERFALTRFNEAGARRYVLAADKLVHLQQDDTSLLTRPFLRQFHEGKPEVRMRAKRAVVTAGGEVAHLHDEVEVVRPGEPARPGQDARPDTRVTTTYLRVLPDSDRADTPEPVRIEQGESIVTGVGMDFDDRYQRVNLRSQVKASFAPRRDAAAKP